MMQPTDIIVAHKGNWRHIPTGEIHIVKWCAPREVVTIVLTEPGRYSNAGWVGKAVQFIQEFEIAP